MTNEQRVAIARKALLLVDDSLVCDLLANLMHYCGKERFDAELRIARMHYAAESKGEHV